MFGYPDHSGVDHMVCLVCNWKRSNPEIAFMMMMKKWPLRVPVAVNQNVLSFLLADGATPLLEYHTDRVKVRNPQWSTLQRIAHNRAWRSLLQTGVREPSSFLAYGRPLSHDRLVSGECSTPEQSSRAPEPYVNLSQQWPVILRLCRNLFWVLAFACFHSSSQRDPEAGRPLTMILSFLGNFPHVGGDDT